MKKICSPYLILFIAVLLAALFIVLGMSLTVEQAAAQLAPQPGKAPRPTPKPTANLIIRHADSILSPKVLSSGQPMTYTFDVFVGEPSMDARDAVLELPFNGNQQFLGFSTDNPNFKLREPVGETVFV